MIVLQGTTARLFGMAWGISKERHSQASLENIGIAGHRDTYFRSLKDIRKNDEIQIQTAAGITDTK